MQAVKWCPVRLLATHSYPECNNASDAKFICGINRCDKHHHKTLHGSTTPFIENVNATHCEEPSTNSVHFFIQFIPTVRGNMLKTMFDNCASCTLITRPAAACLQLKGKMYNMSVRTVTSVKVVQSYAYIVPLYDKNKECHFITAYEIESIASNISEVDISAVKHLFSDDTQAMWDIIKNRPTGEIDLLIGSSVLGLHPRDLECIGNLRVLSSLFDGGYIITGSHPSIKPSDVTWNEDVAAIRHVINRVTVEPVYDYFEQDDIEIQIEQHDQCRNCKDCGGNAHIINRFTARSLYDTLEHDNLGILPPRRCKSCQNCKECSFRGHMLSQEDQYQYQVLESKVHYDKDSESFTVTYPFTEDPKILPDNERQVIKIAEREENRLIKAGLLEEFNNEFDKMIRHWALVELVMEERNMWKEPKH